MTAGNGEPWTCLMVNGGSREDCALCRTKKPRKPVLLWPTYLAACKKHGVEPRKEGE